MTKDNSAASSDDRRLQDFVAFGEMALAADDMDELLDVAVANVARGLDTNFAKILKWQPHDKSLLVVAGVGWRDGVVGNVTLRGDRQSPAGYAFQTGNSVRSNDFTQESRFDVPGFLVEHDIKSAINVVIAGVGAPYGVLEVDSRQVSEFSDADSAYLRTYAQLLSAAILRVDQTEKLTSASRENTLLLNELHHRISNDLQLVQSLINHRSRAIADGDGRRELRWVSTRLRALTQLHSHLRKAGSSDLIDLSGYISDLGHDLTVVHSLESRSIDLKVATLPWTVTSSDAVSIGLVVNEFVTNSVEHAFPDGGGTISLTLKQHVDGAVLTLKDDGPGFDPALPTTRSGRGLMLKLAQSVSGDVIVKGDDGAFFEMILLRRADGGDDVS